ncbi:hypothetical protein F5B18DRAFT_20040 [Nemania serpens]|nr:hypothetical protein F5B18DRAFT_20040 [Nemania serpens]
MEDKAEARGFRAIIVGGGLLGLTAAHMFSKTDMDYVVLEQHEDLVPEIGSLLVLLPPTYRVLDQLGILDAVRPIIADVTRSVLMSAVDGTVWNDENLTQLLEANHGHSCGIVHRPHYAKALYDTLPETAKARIHVRKRVVRIEVAEDGVAVHCADGSVEHGSVVIGADGVHSRTRQAMQSLAAGLASDTEQPSPYVTTYRALIGNLPALPDLPPSVNYQGAASGVSTQILTSARQAWFAVYEKLETPATRRVRWTEDDKEEVLERWGHLHLAPGYRVRDAWARREGDIGLINLEEGLADTWSWRRIVLVGDAVRKLEPHAGLGYNTGVGDVVELVNGLRRLTRRGKGTTTGDLEALFAAYRARRMEDTPAVVDMSEKRARMCAWLTGTDWFVARVVVPWLPVGTYSMNYILGPILSRSPVLEWLDEKQLPAQAMPYAHHPRPDAEEEEVGYYSRSREAKGSVVGLSLWTGTIALAALVTMGYRVYKRI